MHGQWWVGIIGWAVLSFCGARISPFVMKDAWRSEETRLGKVISTLGYAMIMTSFVMLATSVLLFFNGDRSSAIMVYLGAVAIGVHAAGRLEYFTQISRKEINTQKKL